MRLLPTIPIRLEREYMLQRGRLVDSLAAYTLDMLNRRTDALEDEILAVLGIGARDVFDDEALRARLTMIALRIGDDRRNELRRLLGPIPDPDSRLLSRWVDRQVDSIQVLIQTWLNLAGEELRRAFTERLPTLEVRPRLLSLEESLRRQQQSRASAAVLSLNADIIRQVAQGAGVSHYRWVTQGDPRVRLWHAELEFTVQAWADPPKGGGTKREDRGHPGSGYGCRCLSELIATRPSSRRSAAISAR